MVYVRKGGQLQPLAQPYSGPYKVLERGPKYFRLDIGGKSTAVTVDRLKPHTGTTETAPAAPPRRGYPPRQRPAATAAHLASYAGDDNGTDYTDLTGNASDVNSTDNTSPGTLARTSSHYRGSPCAPAQSSLQIRPLSDTKRSGGSDVATRKKNSECRLCYCITAADHICL
jgi:hypothetical protein